MARTPRLPEKPLHWVGSAKKDLLRIRTAGTDVELIRQRLKTAREDYEVRYGKKA